MHNQLITIEAENVAKKFGKILLFSNINFRLCKGDSFYITGPNGSGKSTLLQILAGIQNPSSGRIIYTSNNSVIENDSYKKNFGFTGPQVNPYDMLTSIENLKFTASESVDENLMTNYLERFDLYKHRSKLVKHYSSGMKQRLRLIHALINDPGILMLDEPCSNLDSKGRDILYRILEEIQTTKIIILATNESEDINLCSKGINLEQ